MLADMAEPRLIASSVGTGRSTPNTFQRRLLRIVEVTTVTLDKCRSRSDSSQPGDIRVFSILKIAKFRSRAGQIVALRKHLGWRTHRNRLALWHLLRAANFRTAVPANRRPAGFEQTITNLAGMFRDRHCRPGQASRVCWGIEPICPAPIAGSGRGKRATIDCSGVQLAGAGALHREFPWRRWTSYSNLGSSSDRCPSPSRW